MNMLNMQFDQSELNSAPSYELLPKGNYAAQIVNSEIKENCNGGNRLSLQWEIVDGQYAGRIVFQNININHANPEVVRIGRQQIAQICAAIGRNSVNDLASCTISRCRFASSSKKTRLVSMNHRMKSKAIQH